MNKLPFPLAYRFMLLLLIGCFAIACKKEVAGCTNPDAINYNPDATIDESRCKFVADEYEGIYFVKDTIHRPTQTVFRNYSVVLARKANDTIAFINFNDFCAINMHVTLTTMAFAKAKPNCVGGSGNGPMLDSLKASTSNGRIRFSFLLYGLTVDTIRGVAVKQ